MKKILATLAVVGGVLVAGFLLLPFGVELLGQVPEDILLSVGVVVGGTTVGLILGFLIRAILGGKRD